MPSPAGRQRAGHAHADRHVALEDLLGEQAARLAQAPAVVREECAIDQFGGAHIAAHRLRIYLLAAEQARPFFLLRHHVSWQRRRKPALATCEFVRAANAEAACETPKSYLSSLRLSTFSFARARISDPKIAVGLENLPAWGARWPLSLSTSNSAAAATNSGNSPRTRSGIASGVAGNSSARPRARTTSSRSSF